MKNKDTGMAICLHKLINRASVIAPILNQSRQIGMTTHCLAQFHAQVTKELVEPPFYCLEIGIN